MDALAVMDRGWVLYGGMEQWRRTIGVPRRELLDRGLLPFVHPDDAVPLLRMAAMAEHTRWRERLRLGRANVRVLADVELGRWTPAGLAPICVSAVEPLPISAWWLPPCSFGRLGACPTAVRA